MLLVGILPAADPLELKAQAPPAPFLEGVRYDPEIPTPAHGEGSQLRFMNAVLLGPAF